MTSILLVFVKKYWYHLVLVGLTATAALSVRSCINERDKGIRDRATRAALIVRDSIQVAALRDSLVSTRTNFDSSAKALRSIISTYETARQSIGSRTDAPAVGRASIVEIDNTTILSAADVIAHCKEFIVTATNYKLYADSTIAAQERIIHNLSGIPQTIVKNSNWPLKKLGTVALVSFAGGILLAKSF